MALKSWSKDVDIDTQGEGLGTLRLTVNEDSTDIGGNYSNCSYTLQLIIKTNYKWRASSGSWSVWGSTSNSGNIASMVYYTNTTTLASGSFTVGHGSDGTGSFSIGFSFTSSYRLGGSDTLSGTLTTIPRKATLTEAPNFNDEANPKIKYSNKAGNSASSLQVCIANSSGSVVYAQYRDISKTGSEYTFNLTDAERTALRTAATTNSLSVRFYIKTVIGGTTYYDYAGRTMSIVNANPVFNNFLFEDVNQTTLALTGNNQYNINGYSNIQITIPSEYKAEALKNATMSKYRFTVGTGSVDINYSDSEDVSGVLNNVTNGTYTVYAIDSRNNSTPVSKVAEQVITYEPLYIDKTSSSVTRNNNQVGDEAILNLQGTIWNNDFGIITNSIKNVSYQLKKTGSSTWIDGTTAIQLTVTENNFSFTGSIASDNQDTSWDLDESYNVKVIIEDELSTAEVEFILPSAIPTMSMAKNGVGIMCAYDNNIGGSLQVKGKRILDIDSIYPVGSIYMNINNVSPATLFGGTWERLQDRFLVASGSTYSGTGGSATHKHSIPNHAHGLGSGFAQIIIRSGNQGVEYNEKGTSAWTANYWSRGGSGSGGSSGPHTLGGALGGSTDNKTGLNTNDASSIPPYQAIYVWKRTA